MSKNIEIVYIWDKNNIEKLFNASYKYLFENSYKRYIGWLFIALLQFGVVVAFKNGTFGLLLFSTIVLIYWYYGKKYIAKKRAVNFFEKSPFKDKKIKISANKSGLKIDSINSNFWKWEDIDKVVSINDDILLYKEPNFHYIPSSAFKSIDDKTHFKKLAKDAKVLK